MHRLIDEFELTHQQVAEAVGRSRATVSNLLRLLDLADAVKEKVNQGLLKMGHARALLALIRHDQIEIAKLVVNRGLSVRETEALVKKRWQAKRRQKTAARRQVDPDIRRLEDRSDRKAGRQGQNQAGEEGARASW